MKPLENIFAILLAIGAIQGIIYGFILIRKNTPNKLANKFLSTILFFFSYRLIVELLKLFGIGYYDIFYHFFLEFNWIYGALIYLYVKAYIIPNYKFKLRIEWIHFLPVVIEVVWSIFIKSQNFYWDGTRESLSWLGYYGYVAWMHYPIIYIVGGLLIIYYTSKAKLLINTSNSNNISINEKSTIWILRILQVLKYFSAIIILIVLIDFFFFDYAFNRIYHYPLFVGLAIITYWMGIEGFNRKSEVVLKLKNTLSLKENTQLNEIAEKLTELMKNDKVYLDQNLNLKLLSEHLNEKPYLTTKCLNIIFEKKFSDYINAYRIEELKRLLKDPNNNNLTLLALAFDSGFNSKASFNRAVKKLTGKPPGALKHP